MAKKPVTVISDIPRYAKKGETVTQVDDFTDKDKRRMRVVQFKDKSILNFGDRAFDAMLKYKT